MKRAPAKPVVPVAWDAPGAGALEKAQNGSKPIVIFFADEEGKHDLIGHDITAIEAKAVFVKVAFSSDREKSPVNSPVPTSKLASANPTLAYNVRSYPTTIVTDQWGNEYAGGRFTSRPTAKALEAAIDGIGGKVEKANKDLQKGLDAANKAKDNAAALKALMKNFKSELVGMEAQNASITKYNEIMDAYRAEIEELKGKGGDDMIKGLKVLKLTLKGTELEAEVDAALKGNVQK